MSGASGGTRAPPPPRQLYFERCLWPAARRLGSAVRLASLLLILFLLRSPLPFIRPRLEVGTPPPHPAAPSPSTHTLFPLESWGRNSENFQPGQRALGAGRRSEQPVPLRLSGAAAACSRHPRRRGATHCSVLCLRSVPDSIPAESPHPPFAFRLPKALFVFSLSFSFLLCERGAGGKRRRNSFPA